MNRNSTGPGNTRPGGSPPPHSEPDTPRTQASPMKEATMASPESRITRLLRAPFEGIVLGGELVIAIYVAIALNPALLAPSAMAVVSGLGIYICSRIAATRRLS